MKFVFLHPCRGFPIIQRYQLGLFAIITSLRAQGHDAYYLPVTDTSIEIDEEIDVIGIYTIDCMLPYIKDLADKYKKNHIIMLGGPTATIAPEHCKQETYFDLLFQGDDIQSILTFANSEGKDTSSFWFGEAKVNYSTQEGIDQLDILDKCEYLEDLQFNYVMTYGSPYSHVYASRGCAFSCAYCSNSAYNKLGCTLRYRDPKKIVDELLANYHLKPSIIVFEDDILTTNRRWFKQLMYEFKTRMHDPFGTLFEMNTRVNCMSKDQVELAKSCGCHCIRFGVESGTEEIRKQMNRCTMTNKDIKAFASMIVGAEINTYINSIIGVPPETPELFEKTEQLVDEVFNISKEKGRKCTVILNTFYPLMGTPLYDYCVTNDLIEKRLKGIAAHVSYALKEKYITRKYILEKQKLFRDKYKGMISLDGSHYA